jgi:hypothetical protein
MATCVPELNCQFAQHETIAAHRGEQFRPARLHSTSPFAPFEAPACDLDWSDEDAATQPDFARLDAPRAIDQRLDFAMVADSGEHPDVPISFRLTTKGAHSDLATIDPVGWVP